MRGELDLFYLFLFLFGVTSLELLACRRRAQVAWPGSALRFEA